MRDMPALVLNADFRPMSVFPLSTLPWQEAVCAVVKDTVAVVAEYDVFVPPNRWSRSVWLTLKYH